MQYILTEEEYKNLVPKSKVDNLEDKIERLNQMVLNYSEYKCRHDMRLFAYCENVLFNFHVTSLKVIQNKRLYMAKKEFKIGEVFQCGLLKLKCKKSTDKMSHCAGCYFGILDCTDMIYMLGQCAAGEREDGCNVIFVEVED